MDVVTKQLFGRFPREIGVYRYEVNRVQQFEDYVFNKCGIEDIYTSLYPSNFLIDKVFFDLDWGNQVLGDAKSLFKTCESEGFQTIPVISGKKGFHLYPIVRPKIHGTEAKIRLLRLHYYLIEKTFGKFKQEKISLPNGKEVSVLRTKDRIIAPDPQICGDVRRITRVPNTLRPPENLNYCTYVDPDKFLDMDEQDIIEHMKSTHEYKIKINYRKAPNLEDFSYDFENPPNYNDFSPISSENVVKSHITNRFLKGILRPCLYRHITSIHPSNDVRFYATLDLLTLGLQPDNIISIYSGLGWEDFNEMLTKKRIHWIKYKMETQPEIYHSPPCGKLRSKGIPRVCCVE